MGLSRLGKVLASIQSVPDAPSTSSGCLSCVPGQLLELFKKKNLVVGTVERRQFRMQVVLLRPLPGRRAHGLAVVMVRCK